MSLRARLLLISLVTLSLPWAGCEYARQMETVLRSGQEAALLTTARTLARVLIADPESVDAHFLQSSENSANKFFAGQLTAQPLIDGFADEWPQPARPLPNQRVAGHMRLGLYGAGLYAFIRTTDAHVVYESPAARSDATIDRVLLLTRDVSGVVRAWSLSALAPGPVIVRRASNVAPWNPTQDEEVADTDDHIRGIWCETQSGFDIELRIPLRLLGAQFALVHLGDQNASDDIELHSLHFASEPLRAQLALYAPEGLRIAVLDDDGWLLARAGSLRLDDDASTTPSWYRWFVGRSEEPAPTYGLPYGMWGPPIDDARKGQEAAIWFQAAYGEPSTVRAAVPIKRGDEVLGVISVEQAGGALLDERDAALASLLRYTLLATVAAVLIAFTFAAWLSRRIRRLSIAAASALSPHGDVDVRLPETAAQDELGDLARSYALLLQRFKDYTLYLRTLGSKLSHEFRTPLAIVSSSLDNLAAETASEQSRDPTFIQRAREGTARLQSILTAMTEATRVEQSIETAERVEFDLADLLRGVGQAYAHTFATHRIEVQLPSAPCPLYGAPELIVQMLDKLVDNAVDFCLNGQRIWIALERGPKSYRLSVANEGPLLAPDAENKIFDMLISERAGDSAKPHLGLGLFIVQLIARFHGGVARARNLTDLTGVIFEIELPMPRNRERSPP